MKLDELEQIARAATDGPWTCAPGGQRVNFGVDPIGWITVSRNAKNDQAHIAAFNPKRALALIARIRRLEEACYAAETILMVSPPVTTNALGKRPTMTTEGALRRVREAQELRP